MMLAAVASRTASPVSGSTRLRMRSTDRRSLQLPCRPFHMPSPSLQLLFLSFQLPSRPFQLSFRSFQLPFPSCQLSFPSCQLPFPSCQLSFPSCQLPFPSFRTVNWIFPLSSIYNKDFTARPGIQLKIQIRLNRNFSDFQEANLLFTDSHKCRRFKRARLGHYSQPPSFRSANGVSRNPVSPESE